MTAEYIVSLANRHIKKYGTRNPFELAEHLGINIMMRNDFDRLKGMYRVICKNRFIFINANLPYNMQCIVCAHEIGHDQMHRTISQSLSLQEHMLYDMTSQPEYEANIYACSLLIPDNEVLSLAQNGYDSAQIASMLNVDINFLHIKLNCMARLGIPLNSDFYIDWSFLGK